MFSLHVIQAEFGDCLLLEYGTSAEPSFTLIDGGPPGTFESALKKALQDLVVPRGAKLERVVLSHVDGDHVAGLIELITELRNQQANGQPQLVSIGGLWHNSFSRTLDESNALSPRMASLMAFSGMQSTMAAAAVSINTIADGNKLRQFALAAQIAINQDLPDPIIVESAASDATFGNLALKVVGPTKANLEALRDEWEEWLDENEEGIASGNVRVMANADQSIPNLSSICLIATADGKSILLTGDARSDHILDGLKKKNVLDGSGRAHFDVFKVPHHGSDRNITKTFFRKITADRYVFSANGKHENPDLATLIWLVEAAKEQDRKPKICVTNTTSSTKKLLTEYPPVEYGYSLHVLPASDVWMTISLA